MDERTLTVTLEEWLTVTHHMADKALERERINQVIAIEQRELGGSPQAEATIEELERQKILLLRLIERHTTL